VVVLLAKLVVATGLSRTLVMKTGEGFMATAEYGESGLCGDLKAACDVDEGQGVAAHAAWWGLKGFEVMPGNLRLQVTETRVEDLIRKKLNVNEIEGCC
jgi:hypothetical protein